MIKELLNNLLEYLLVIFCPDRYEYRSIERVNSTGSLVEYSDFD